MTIATEVAPTAVGRTEAADGLTWTQVLAGGAKFYMTLYDGVDLGWLLTSPDPGYRELGEALVATGEASFVPNPEARATLRARFGADCMS